MSKIKVLNLIQHKLSDDQVNDLIMNYGAEIVTLPAGLTGRLQQCPDNVTELLQLCNDIVLCASARQCLGFLLPGGSPAFNALLSVRISGFKQFFSHSVREYAETVQSDGSVLKTNVFKHVKWIVL